LSEVRFFVLVFDIFYISGWLSEVEHTFLFESPTDAGGVDCSLPFTLRSANGFGFRRLFGVLHFAFDRHQSIKRSDILRGRPIFLRTVSVLDKYLFEDAEAA
jgi:hypothetical protein